MITVECIEKFEPPMWEDIANKFEFKFIGKNKKNKIDAYSFEVSKNGFCSSFIIINKLNKYFPRMMFCRLATKENYIKACEIVRDLFNKGSVK